MERILSQQEIDELIRDLGGQTAGEKVPERPRAAVITPRPSSGELDQVVPYDFRRPSKFSRDQLRSLERIHQQFGRLLGILLGARLRTDLAIRVVSVQQLTYGEFIRSVPNPSALGVFDFGSRGDRMVVQLSLELAYGIYERLAGGPGSTHARTAGREPTDIELQVLRHQVLGMVGDAYRQAWGAFLPLNIELRDMETNPVYINLMLDQDTVLWVSLAVELGEQGETINLCLPYSSLEPLLPRLSNEYLLRAQARPDARDRERMQRLLRHTVVPVQAVLGRVELELQELMDLKVGDVLVLDTGTQEEMELHVAGRPKFKGRAGRLGRRLAVRITAPIRDLGAELDPPDATVEAAAGDGAGHPADAERDTPVPTPAAEGA